MLMLCWLLLASASAHSGARRKGRPWLEMMGWAMGMAPCSMLHGRFGPSAMFGLSCLYRYKDRCKVARWGCWR